jgi:hypothetical protein
VPAQDSRGLHEGDGLAPTGNKGSSEQQAQPVCPRQLRSRTLATQDDELMAQQRVFNEQLVTRSAGIGRQAQRGAGVGQWRQSTPYAPRASSNPIGKLTKERDHGTSNRSQREAALRVFSLRLPADTSRSQYDSPDGEDLVEEPAHLRQERASVCGW